MKRNFKILFSAVLVVSLITAAAFGEGVQNEENSDTADYAMDFAIGFNPLGLLLTGPTADFEYMGLGAFTVYAGGMWVGPGLLLKRVTDDTDVKINGFGGFLGGKFYYQFGSKQHDSRYVAVEYNYSFIGAEYTGSSDSIDVQAHIFMVYHGWRWQWSTFYIDFRLGAGYGLSSVDVTGNFNSSDKETIQDAFSGFNYGGFLTFGVAF